MSVSSPFVADMIATLIPLLLFMRRWHRQRDVKLPQLPQGPPWQLPHAPLVSIVVPARNEAHQITACVQSLLNQDYPWFEVIVVDDCSEDDTEGVLARLAATDSRLTVVRGNPTPEGWLGKTHAICQGYQNAKGAWILFTDADTVHAPGLLPGMMTLLLHSSAACATVIGRYCVPTRGAYVGSLAWFTCGFLLLDPKRHNDPQSPVSWFNGQYILFFRETYDAIGTHAAVRAYSGDDEALGYLVKLHGYVPLLIDSGESLRITLYRTLLEAWQGWPRSVINSSWTMLGPGMGSVSLVILAAVMWLLWITPWVVGSRAVVRGDPMTFLATGCLFYAGFSVLYRVRSRWLPAVRDVVVMPLSTLLLTAMVGSGLVRAWRHGYTIWKGREVHTTRCCRDLAKAGLHVRDT